MCVVERRVQRSPYTVLCVHSRPPPAAAAGLTRGSVFLLRRACSSSDAASWSSCQCGAPPDSLPCLNHSCCVRRAILGVLPRIMLQLPDDYSGILHSMSCLVEAVLPSAQEEQAADSEDCGAARVPPTKHPTAPAVRLTLYASGDCAAMPVHSKIGRGMLAQGCCLPSH